MAAGRKRRRFNDVPSATSRPELRHHGRLRVTTLPGLIPAVSAAKLVKRLSLTRFKILAKPDKIEDKLDKVEICQIRFRYVNQRAFMRRGRGHDRKI
jgi:hypothetical protein